MRTSTRASPRTVFMCLFQVQWMNQFKAIGFNKLNRARQVLLKANELHFFGLFKINPNTLLLMIVDRLGISDC